MKTIAIVKDRTGFWSHYRKEFEKYGFQVRLFDIWQRADQERLLSGSFDAFVWRAKHNPRIKRLARRFLYFFDRQIGLPCYPEWNAYWHYDDKIAQAMILKKYDIKHPDTHIFFEIQDALNFIRDAQFPLVYKCAHGAGSANVGLLKNERQARAYIKKVFTRGVKTFFKNEIQRDYVYLQEFLPGNRGDYKIICYGDHTIHGFFRENRADCPMASGSGKAEIHDLDNSLLHFVSDINRKLGFNVMSYDLLKDGQGQWAVSEFGIIFGDLTNKTYDQTPIYYRRDQQWEKQEMHDNQIERLVRYLLKTQWQWI